MKRLKLLFLVVIMFSFFGNIVNAYNWTSTSAFHVRYYRDYSSRVTSTSGNKGGYAEASAKAKYGAISWNYSRYNGQQVFVQSYSSDASGSGHWHGSR